MPIVDKELVGKALFEDENKFLPSHYAPKVHGYNVDAYISDKLKTNEDKPWIVRHRFGP